VLSTLHTNDAASAATRLIEMGAPPYLICGALAGVLAQRLARRLCPQCRRARAATRTELTELGFVEPGALELCEPVGCAACDGHGYHGRTGVFELVTLDGALRDLIMRRASADAVRKAALAAGATTLADDVRQKVLAGDTSLEEIRPLLISHL